jgi:nucleotide sugar dehydrogenase
MNIGIIGNGFVGKATALLGCRDDGGTYRSEDNVIMIYDKDPEKRVPSEIELHDLKECDVVFVCVPTPMNEDGSCHTGIVEEVIENLRSNDVENIVIRSTVPVGFCRELGVNFMPEFLTEANWREDFKSCKNWVFGLDDPDNKDLKLKLRQVFLTAKHNGKIDYANFMFCPSEVAELSKYARNCFLATKVSFFNEIEEFCRVKDISYEQVRELVGMDDRIGASHTSVPGPDGKRGFGGTCFPKDIGSLFNQMASAGMESYVVEAASARNVQVDRKGQDWKNDKGRAVV